MKPAAFTIQSNVAIDNLIGGVTRTWAKSMEVFGYIDLLTGSDDATLQDAFLEQSTHVLIIPEYVSGITDQMRVLKDDGRWYEITYVDDPMDQHHHIEVFLKYGGVVNV